MSPPLARREDDTWHQELGDVRERLARLEARAEAHDAASAERHRQLLRAVREIEGRLTEVEGRSWKVALALAALGAGGGAGVAELLRSLAGG